MTPPEDRKYTAMHEWLLLDGDVATVGITAYAAYALGDVVYVQAPTVDAQVTTGEVCGEIESTKSVSDLFAPADGTVLEVNQQILDDPGAVNTDPYGAGWLFRMTCSSLPDLLDAAAYVDLIDNGE